MDPASEPPPNSSEPLPISSSSNSNLDPSKPSDPADVSDAASAKPKKRDLRPEEYSTSVIGVLRRWDFNIQAEEAIAPPVWKRVLCSPSRILAKFTGIKHQVAILLRFMSELSAVTGGFFWVLAAIRIVKSFVPAVDLYLSEKIIGMASRVGEGGVLSRRKLARTFAAHFLLNALSSMASDVSYRLEKVVRSRMELETKYQVLKVHCKLDDIDLLDPRVQERLRKMKKVEEVNVFEFLSAATQLSSLLTEGAVIARRVNKSNAPLILMSGGLFALRYLTESYYWDYPTTEPCNDAHMRLENLFEVGTSPALRREVVSFNLQSFILDDFNAARAKLGDIVFEEPEPDWNNRSLPSLIIDLFHDSSRMLTYVLFALTAASGRSSLASLTQLTHLSGSVTNWLWSSHWLSSTLKRRWQGLEAIEAYFDCRKMAEKAESMKASNPYVPMKDEAGVNVKGMKLEFKNVSMRYPEAKKQSLTDVSFTILPGQLVSLVGHNGSGKTTLISLLAQGVTHASGEILINEKKIESYTKTDLLSRMSFTFQSSPSLPFSIREFVGLGYVDDKDDDQLVKDALVASGAEEVALSLEEGWWSYPAGGSYSLPRLVPTRPAIPRLVPRQDEFAIGLKPPDGEDAPPEHADDVKEQEKEAETDKENDAEVKPQQVKDNNLEEVVSKVLDVKITDANFAPGVLRDMGGQEQFVEYPTHAATSRGLSGGQWQRIALARGLMNKNNDLLSFDEPCGNLDAIAESAFFDTILSLKGKSTILFSTHRFSITSKADLILMFVKGKLVEQGTHAELMAIEAGEYRKMWELQAQGYQDESKKDGEDDTPPTTDLAEDSDASKIDKIEEVEVKGGAAE